MKSGIVFNHKKWNCRLIRFSTDCRAYCYEVIQDIQEGSRTVPSFEELSSEFPALVW